MQKWQQNKHQESQTQNSSHLRSVTEAPKHDRHGHGKPSIPEGDHIRRMCTVTVAADALHRRYGHHNCDNILSGYLCVVTTVFSQQDGIYGFKFLTRFFGDLLQRSHSFCLFWLFSWSNHLKTWLSTQPLELMPFPFAFAWLDALHAVRRLKSLSDPVLC